MSSDSESDIGLKRNLRDDWLQQQMYIKCQKHAEHIWDSFTHGTGAIRQKEIEEEEEEAKKEKEKKDKRLAKENKKKLKLFKKQ